MKSLVRSFSVFFLLFSFSILFISCSQESAITSPNENDATSMAKTTVLPTASINHSTDTVITLPKSGKTLVLSKSYTAKQLSQIDDYLATHTITTKTSFATPNALPCNMHYTYNTILENEYEPAYQKNIGIWCNYLTYYQCRNYGFNQYFVGHLSDTVQFNNAIKQAIDSGFVSNNIMADLGDDYSNANLYIKHTPKNIGYYFIDEPAERNTYTPDQIYNLDTALTNRLPNVKLCLASFDGFDVVYYGPIVLNEANSEIMCDEYHGNCLGNASDYWQWFRNQYTTHSNLNWMHVVINNGIGGGHNTCNSNNSDSWLNLFSKANSLGENNVWLYALLTGNEAAVLNFCYAAWQSGWMYRYQLTLATEWQCDSPNPCTNCVWSSSGDWQIVQANIVWNGQWVSY